MRQLVLPVTIILFALISVSILMSIAPSQGMRQLVFFSLGLLGFASISRFSFDTLLRISPVLYIGLNSLLVFTLLFATVTRGTVRWISIGDLFVLQPSQIAIPVTALFILHFLRKNSIKKVGNLIRILFIIALPACLILIAPDLDTTIVFLGSLGTLLWFSNIQTKHMLFLGLIGCAIAVCAWFFVLKDYQKERFTSFFAGKAEEQETHYNAQQALIAIGSGQLYGRGLGQGVQSHLRFLPARQTDFIFASFAEEYGFIGSAGIVFLYGILCSYCVYLGFSSKDYLEQVFCFTIASAILLQAGVNLTMNLGLIPIAGLTLPLLSYGGSSVISVCCTLGILQIIAQKPRDKFTLHLS